MPSDSSTPPADNYTLGRTPEEYERLRHQARAWEVATKQVLQQAGLREGMSSLDLGCGPGEVMRLMGEMVGTSGHVTGLDTDGQLGRQAVEMLRTAIDCPVNFLELDFEAADDVPERLFDLTYARLVLFHVRDPIAVLRKMAAWTKPGGCIVVQDFDLCSVGTYPRLNSLGEFNKVVLEVFRQNGRDVYLGHKLPSYFVEAGLGSPDGTDVSGLIGPIAQYGAMMRGVYLSLLPRALQMGLTTEPESRAFLEELSEAERSDRYGSVLLPLLIGAWKRKPLQP